jgi:regulator of sirC expression with transglutaminase-like and TPR domain
MCKVAVFMFVMLLSVLHEAYKTPGPESSQRSQAINSTLYSKNGFRGADPQHYYNPDNSCMNMVRTSF